MRSSIHRVVAAAAVVGALTVVAAEARAQQVYVDPGGGQMVFNPRIFIGVGVGYNYLFTNSLYFAPEGAAIGDPSVQTHFGSQHGFNWTLYAGVRLHQWIALELAWDAIYHSSAESGPYNYALIDGIRLAGRIYFPTGLNILPFLRLGLGYYFYGDEWGVDRQGLGYSAGLGVNYQFNQALEMDFVILYRAWYFEGMDAPSVGEYRCGGGGYCPFGDDYVHSVNLQLNFHWNSWLFSW